MSKRGRANSALSEEREKVTAEGLGQGENATEEPQKVKKPRPPRPKLTAELLLGEKGLPRIIKTFPKHLPSKGEGKEKKNLSKLLKMYKQWGHQLIPFYTFGDIVQRSAKISPLLCRTWLQKARDGDTDALPSFEEIEAQMARQNVEGVNVIEEGSQQTQPMANAVDWENEMFRDEINDDDVIAEMEREMMAHENLFDDFPFDDVLGDAAGGGSGVGEGRGGGEQGPNEGGEGVEVTTNANNTVNSEAIVTAIDTDPTATTTTENASEVIDSVETPKL